MKTFRIIMLVILGILDLYLAYSVGGYLIQGLDYPKIVGETTARFCGMFIMSGTFFVLFVIVTIIYIIILKRLLKMEKK